ncbi:hypothetical protein HPP92_026852 [Vanilla planifolia]|uniref:ABC1 atypical kinase-like domain-containing protein n=1 Tax=Vanilla planifolia TaxID=51239 RepID=A0A835U8R6_VANPL|nr:hypothetical protein HPP92_026852 [Vanilla planifolia]
MALVVVANGNCCSNFNPSERGVASCYMRFSGSISKLRVNKYEILSSKFLRTPKSLRLNAEMQHEDSDKTGTNGRASKMVSTEELMRTWATPSQKARSTNGSVIFANGPKRVVNGTGVVKRMGVSLIPKTQMKQEADDLSFVNDLKILPSDENFRWSNENYNAWLRSIDIWSFIFSLRIRVLFDNAKWSYLRGFTEDKQKKRRQRTAAWCREKILQLGPTFIKLGQLSSTRSDLFPKEFVDELAKLQDRVPAFSPAKAKGFIKDELGSPVEVLFKDFEDRPIAAASLGQVHRAMLHNGEKKLL